MTQALQRAVRTYALARADPSGLAATALGGVGVMVCHAPTGIIKSVYKPLICLVLQGAKLFTTGRDSYEFTSGQSVIVSADVPVSSCITQASRAEPYIGMGIELDMAVLLELSVQLGGATDTMTVVPTVLVDETDAAVADCALRLMRLLDRPEAIPLLQPSITRELHYWLLTGRHGRTVRGLARPGGTAQRIAQAVALLRSEFDRPLRVERLASAAGMSASSFHHHFRAVTSLSPIQFQKQLRLIEARRRMLADGLPAKRAALEVGYESITQFTREYGRLFGLPPRRDVSESRGGQPAFLPARSREPGVLAAPGGSF